jgi:hypothetical protein
MQDRTRSLPPTVTLRRLAELKAMWGVSIAGLIMRARQVEAIGMACQESLFKQLSARGWRLTEPVRVHREQPALLPRLRETSFGRLAPSRQIVGSAASLTPRAGMRRRARPSRSRQLFCSSRSRISTAAFRAPDRSWLRADRPRSRLLLSNTPGQPHPPRGRVPSGSTRMMGADPPRPRHSN